MELDQFQRDFIACQTDKVLVAGRQTGKSEAAAYDNGFFAATHPGTNALIVSKTERQAQELVIKCLNYLQEYYPDKIGKGQYKPLKSVIWVVHKGKKPARIMSHPIGLAGEGVRGFTIDKLTIDEAQLPPDEVFNALSPMLLVTGGKISLLGTPQGKRGFFWEAYENKTNSWAVFHVSSEEVINNRPISKTWAEWRKTAALAFLEKERTRMSLKHYQQEYLGMFIEDLAQMYPDELIKKCCILKRGAKLDNKKYFLGVDVGRIVDPSTFQIIDGTDKKNMKHIDNIIRYDYSITQTAQLCVELEHKYKFKKLGIDGGGMGAGVVDILLKNDKTKPKTIDLNNAKRSVTYEDKPKHRPLIKEDMYRNLNILMENGFIQLLDDDEVKNSLKSCQIEYREGSKDAIISGNDTHVVEGIIRGAYLASQQSLNIWAR